jgi:sensor c-di-GMP phosphodiesterase-like protein
MPSASRRIVGRAIIEAILHIDKSLAVEVVAEGIETIAQRDNLKRSGAGSDSAEALPAHEVERRFMRNEFRLRA